MKLAPILKALEIPFELIGNDVFETLGLLESKTEKKRCSFMVDRSYEQHIAGNVSLLIVTEDCRGLQEQYNLCIAENPRLTFFKMHNYLAVTEEYARPRVKSCIDTTAKISPLACISETNVKIGKNVVIEEFVSIKENVIIGDDSIIRAGTIIGGEGFEHKHNGNISLSVVHLGGVVIKNNVEIQYNSCVDKAVYPWDDTVIETGVKIDNLVHVAHGVHIGKGTFVIANVGIGGRTEIGENCWIGLGAQIRNGIVIGDNARVNMGSIVTKNVEKNKSVTGNFAIDHSQFIENLKVLRNGK